MTTAPDLAAFDRSRPFGQNYTRSGKIINVNKPTGDVCEAPDVVGQNMKQITGGNPVCFDAISKISQAADERVFAAVSFAVAQSGGAAIIADLPSARFCQPVACDFALLIY